MLRDNTGNFSQAFIASNMPVAVVKPFEVVYIYKNQGKRARLLRVACIFPVQNFIKMAPVGYACERVCNTQGFHLSACLRKRGLYAFAL